MGNIISKLNTGMQVTNITNKNKEQLVTFKIANFKIPWKMINNSKYYVLQDVK